MGQADENRKLFEYEILNPKIAYPSKGKCRIISREKVTRTGIFRKGDEVITFERIREDGSAYVSIRMTTNDVRFDEI